VVAAGKDKHRLSSSFVTFLEFQTKIGYLEKHTFSIPLEKLS